MSCWGWEALWGKAELLTSCHFPLAGPSGKGGCILIFLPLLQGHLISQTWPGK